LDLARVERERAAAARGLCLRGRLRGGAAAQVLPVVAAARVASEIQLEPDDARLVHLYAAREKRQDRYGELGARDARERLIAKARRVAELRVADGEPYGREQLELEVAGERKLAPGRAGDGCGDFILVIVRIYQH